MRVSFRFGVTVAGCGLAAGIVLAACQGQPARPTEPIGRAVPQADGAVTSAAAKCGGPVVDLTAPALRARLAGARLEMIGQPTVQRHKAGQTSTKVSRARFGVNPGFSALSDEFEIVTTTCTLTCSGRDCSMSGCDLSGSSCSNFDCGNVGQCAGSCTKTQSQ